MKRTQYDLIHRDLRPHLDSSFYTIRPTYNFGQFGDLIPENYVKHCKQWKYKTCVKFLTV